MAKRPMGKTFCILALLCAPVSAACQGEMHVPAARGTNLAGSQVIFPDALTAKVNVIVIGFSHSSQEQVADWGRLMQADYGKSRDFNYFEIAVLAGAPKLVRGMIVRRMGSSVPFDERAHFVPLLEGEPAWRAVAHYHKPEDAYVLLVDRKGVVLSRIEGDATNAAYADFKRQVESMLRATEVP